MKKARKIGIFGGSFNPVHNGHIKLAKTYYDALKLDEILVIPSNIPPHKSVDKPTSAQDRVNMLKLAFKDVPYVTVSDIELKLGGKSYTVFTLTELKKLYPDDELYLIVGGDMFLCFDKWFEYEKILSMCTVCAAPREDGEILKLLAHQEKIDPSRRNTIVLDASVLEVSSSEIRSKTQNKQELKNLVPNEVFEYIVEKGLYNND